MSNADNQSTVSYALTSTLIGFGIIFSLSPLVLYWFIHGDYERYLWITNGPAPFNQFGGGPFQIAMYGGLLLLGIMLLTSGFLVRKKL